MQHYWKCIAGPSCRYKFGSLAITSVLFKKGRKVGGTVQTTVGRRGGGMTAIKLKLCDAADSDNQTVLYL